MNDFACDQHTPQPFACHHQFIERSYMVITQTMHFHRCCKCLQLMGTYHTTAAFDRVRFTLIHSVVAIRCRPSHRCNARLDIGETDRIKLL